MSVRIENLTNRPVLLCLNSGQSLHIAPKKASTEIMDVEVNRNPKVQKLLDRHVIVLHDVKKKFVQTVRGPKKEKSEEEKESKK